MNNGIRAYRKAETVISVAMTFETSVQYSDIILPACTAWETNYPLVRGAYQVTGYHPKEFVILPQKIVEPLYESKDDQELMELLVEALGIEWSEIYTKTAAEEMLGMIQGAYVVAEDGVTQEPLVTIDDDALACYKGGLRRRDV